VGPISAHAVDACALAAFNCRLRIGCRPWSKKRDFAAFDLVIAVKEAEHRPKMQDRFPAWAERISYWKIHDVDCAHAAPSAAGTRAASAGVGRTVEIVDYSSSDA